MHAPIDTKPRWERRKDARPQELLAAALDLFVERGFASTRLEDVAKRAGVSKGTLYLYFENKQELFKAVVRDNIVQSIGEAENSMAASEESSADLLRKVMMQWWEEFGATKLAGLTKLMLAEANNFPELAQFYNEEVVARGNALVVSLLERGMQRGEFRQVDPVLVSTILSAPRHHAHDVDAFLPAMRGQEHRSGGLYGCLYRHERAQPAGGGAREKLIHGSCRYRSVAPFPRFTPPNLQIVANFLHSPSLWLTCAFSQFNDKMADYYFTYRVQR